MIDQRIFEDLQTKIDAETTVRDVSVPPPLNSSRAKPDPKQKLWHEAPRPAADAVA